MKLNVTSKISLLIIFVVLVTIISSELVVSNDHGKAAALMLFSIAAVITIARKYFIKPVITIAKASRKVADGDFSVTVPVKSDDEFGLLSENFNIMVGRLNLVNSELSNYSKNLEYVIELRTERLNSALKELQQQKDFIDRLLATAGALIIVMDESGKVAIFNRKCEELTEFREDEVKGGHVWDFLLPERDIPVIKSIFGNLIDTKLPISIESRLLTKDGEEIDILWNNTVITDDNNEVRWVIASGIDITEKKKLELQLTESQKLQAIGTLSTGLSHNFNNILVGIMGYSGLLRMKLSAINHPEMNEILGYVDIIENSTKKASDFIKQLRSFTSQTASETLDINLNNALNEVLQAITATFPKSVSIETSLSNAPLTIHADKNQIQQVILNICLNAKEAMPDGGTLKIETFDEEIKESEDPIQKAGRYAVIRISDTGHGIDEETKSRIFDPFFTTKGLLKHTGLGLSTAYSIIRNHNGFIKVGSVVNQFAAFTIYLPMA